MKLLGLESLVQHKLIYLGLSGGLDSMVLLDYLGQVPSLYPKLRAIHVHHGISPHADAWLDFCQQQCQLRGIPCVVDYLELNQDANLEARARDGRYQVFLDKTQNGDALVLAHHLDDQIETFFLNAIRGTGLTGLSAMPQSREFKGRRLYRPLLDIARKDLLAYAKAHQLKWLDDESNLDTHYSRNLLRHDILPKIEAHWPHYRASVAHTIASCQNELQIQEQQILKKMVHGQVLSFDHLQDLSQAEIFSYLRLWCKTKGFSIPSRAVLKEIWQQFFLSSRKDANPWVCWGEVSLRSYDHHLYLESLKPQPKREVKLWKNFPQALGQWQPRLSSGPGVHINPLNDKVELRYRQGGETIRYRGHHRCLKKLLQSMKIPPWLRLNLDLLYVNDELQAVLGYIYADQNPLQAGQDCYQMEDMNR